MMDLRQASKPRRIKALLSSFLRKDISVSSASVSKTSSNEGRIDAAPNIDHSIVKPALAVTVQPLNKKSFIQRVDTFTTSTWFAKPHTLSPLHCARYGWQNTDVDVISCVSCKAILVVSLPRSWQNEEYSAACDKLKAELISGHGKICPWSGSPSPESFVTVAMKNAKLEIARYQERVTRLLEIFSNLPCVEFSVLKDQSLEDNVVLNHLVEFTKTLTEDNEGMSDDTWNIIVMMALFGWYRRYCECLLPLSSLANLIAVYASPMCLLTLGSQEADTLMTLPSGDDSTLPVVKCECCRKQAGLWNYTISGDEGKRDDLDQDPGEPPQKKMKELKFSSFHPASEHRPWCPWIYCEPQVSCRDEGQENRPAWLVLLDILLSKADPEQFGSNSPLTNKHQTTPSNAWKAVRRLVSFWQSDSIPVKDIGSSPPSVK